jgi:CRP-like cAMP-binding protein
MNQRGISASLHTKSLKDKYGRRVTRRVIRIAENPQQMKKKKSKKWPKLQKILTPQNMVPKPIQPPPNLKPLIPIGRTATKSTQKKARRKLKQWLKDNAGIIILNFGSICSFISFTRMDILELRVLSVTGSLSSVIYFLSRPPPLVIAPVIWSSVFTGTNLYMIYLIYEERKGKPEPMTAEEESAYEEHFLPYAVTPRQYEKLLKNAKKRELSRGDVLIQKGEKMKNVCLVVSGATEAVNTMSRRVTAASSSKGNKDKLAGGDAGAWIGEIAFFDYLSERDQQTGTFKPSPPPAATKALPLATAAAVGETNTAPKQSDAITRGTATQNSILTYIATKDSTLIYQWDFEELADLMRTSSELRSSVSRAMTAAVVGKVVNLYISKADANKPMWKKWIGDNWQPSVPVSAVRVNVAKE